MSVSSPTTETAKKKGIGKAAMVDVAAVDELKQLGFRLENLKSGFCAYEIHGERVFGPADSIQALLTHVKMNIGNKIELPKDGDSATATASGDAPSETGDVDTEETELSADSNGNAFLPGTAPKVNKQLSAAILKYHRIKMDRVQLTAQETAAREEMTTIAHMHDALYVPDPKKPGTKIYRVDNVISRKKVVEEEKYTTEEVEDE